jgi:cytidine deaminase
MPEPALTEDERALLAEARALAHRSVGPARERAGAVALTRDGTRFPGVAVRIAGAPALSACALPVALTAARAASIEPVEAIALWLPGTGADQPCGLCRQIWSELAPEARLVVQREDGPPQILGLARLLPDPFTHFDPSS